MGRTACTELQCLYKGALYLLHNVGIINDRVKLKELSTRVAM